MKQLHVGAFAAGSEGEVVLLLHGFGSTATQTWAQTGWTAALARAGHGFVAVDLPGHGASEAPHDPAAYRLEVVLADLEALLDAYGHDRVDIAGYSLGAQLALAFAAAHPERVRSVIAGGLPHDAADEHTLALAWRIAACRPGNDLAALQAMMEGLGGFRGSATLFTGPALLFAGELDPLAAETAAVAAELPQASFVSIPDRHHLSTLTAATIKEPALAFLENPVRVASPLRTP